MIEVSEEQYQEYTSEFEYNYDEQSVRDIKQYFESRLYTHVIQCSDAILEKEPNNIIVLEYLACSYLQIKNFKMGIETFNKIAQLTKTSFLTNYNLSLHHYNEGNYDLAYQYCLNACNVNDSDRKNLSYLLMAKICKKMKRNGLSKTYLKLVVNSTNEYNDKMNYLQACYELSKIYEIEGLMIDLRDLIVKICSWLNLNEENEVKLNENWVDIAKCLKFAGYIKESLILLKNVSLSFKNMYLIPECYESLLQFDLALAEWTKMLDMLKNIHFFTTKLKLKLNLHVRTQISENFMLLNEYVNAEKTLTDFHIETEYSLNDYAIIELVIRKNKQLGNLLRKIKNYTKSAEYFQFAYNYLVENVGERPEENFYLNLYAELFNDYGLIFHHQNKYHEALQWFNLSLEYNEKYALAYTNKGIVFESVEQWNEALECQLLAYELDNDNLGIIINLISVYLHKQRFIDAKQLLEDTVSLNRHNNELNRIAGLVYFNLKEYYKSLEFFEKIFEFHRSPQIEYFIIACKQILCIWDDYTELFINLQKIFTEEVASNSVTELLPFHCFTYPIDDELVLKNAQLNANRSILSLKVSEVEPFKHDIEEIPLILKLGFVSGNFDKKHPINDLLGNIYEMFDENEFEIFIFSLCEVKQKHKFSNLIDLHDKPFVEAANVIYSHNIDILIDLNGYTEGANPHIFAMKPSPCQVSFLGYCSTIGGDWMDYFIADPVIIPNIECANMFSEKILMLDNGFSYFCCNYSSNMSYRFNQDINISILREQLNFPVDSFLFANFNQFYKYSPECFSSWISILLSVPNSHLIMLKLPAEATNNLVKFAKNQGIEEERLIFLEPVDKKTHLLRCKAVDLILDTFQVNGHTTTVDALWMGCPVLTLIGTRVCQRVAASLLTANGCEDLIAKTKGEYVDKAIEYAISKEKFDKLKDSMILKRLDSKLFNIEDWVIEFQNGLKKGFHEMFQKSSIKIV
eukprot:TRINITY_DN3134_c0_g1_i3.p1 TRINITY_DN3134_c0_g1~~TRINITY_DN3134_c0_g1_i3.p1  ORF type:complete len:971 (+),score=273.02 TRINITY_DN3134_c0_g1_i3:45-2957(+)